MNRLQKIAHKVVAGFWDGIKIESIKSDGIELLAELKANHKDGIQTGSLINVLEIMEDYHYNLIKKELRDYGLEYADDCMFVKAKGNKLVCILSYKGKYKADEVKSVLKKMGIK